MKKKNVALTIAVLTGIAYASSPQTLYAQPKQSKATPAATPQKKKAHDHGEHEEHDEHEGEEAHDHKEDHGKKPKKKSDGHSHDEKKKDEHSHDEKKKGDDHAAHNEGEEEGHGHGHGEEGSSRVGPDKSITAATREDGIQLALQAVKQLGLKTTAASGAETFSVPAKSVVQFQDENGVYRLRDGWYKLVEVALLSKTSSEFTIRTREIKSSDQIVTEGVPLLRVAELEAWGGSGDGHGH